MPRQSVRSATSGRVTRNESCPCGSGRKYKHCCEGKAGGLSVGARLLLALVLVVALVGVVLAFTTRSDRTAPPGQVWSPEHGHYHDVQ